MPSLEEIEKKFHGQHLTPGEIADLRVVLSGKYAYVMNQLEEILTRKPAVWNELRKEHNSDTATERTWQASELGLQELHWNFQRKKIEKMLSAAKTLLEVKTAEAYNQM